jgi:C-terminal processing protease CtpA/Prc
VEGRIVVVAATLSSGLRRGDEVVAIDGRSIEELLVARSQTISGSPHLVQHRLLARVEVASGLPDTTVNLSLVRDGKSLMMEVRREPIPAIEGFHHPQIERLGHGVYYVDLVHTEWRTIEAAIPKLARARRIVFDLRGSPRDPQFRILQHLLRKPTDEPWLFVPQVIYPDQSPAPTWTASDTILLPALPRIRARVAFLVDASTGSHPESIVALVEGLRLGEIVGTPTAGANGNSMEIQLPGGLSFGFSGLQARRLDGTTYQGAGIQPTQLVTRTLAGVRTGRDEVRDAALQWLDRSSAR